MRRKIQNSFAGIALAIGMISAQAQIASVATVPTGMITCTIPHAATTYLSLPLTADATYTSSVTAVTNTSISVGDSPAPFTTNLAAPATPYFVKFLSGSEMGRVLLITANTVSTLTLDITDNSPQTTSLVTANFSVAVGDTFEIIPADTLASVFGDNSAQNPLVLNGSTTVFKADSIGLYNTSLMHWKTYFFNTTAGHWQLMGSTADAGNTVLFPYSSIAVTRRSSTVDASVILSGRVAEVPTMIKTSGNGNVVYGSTGYAVDMTLSQIQFGSTWATGTNAFTASTLSIWNPTLYHFDTYYQKADSTWRKSSDATTDQSNLVIPAASGICINQRTAVSGATSFLASAMPYSLN